MDKKLRFSNLLIVWYLKNKRDLPWRKTKDPYLVWLSEIILQQTRVAQGTSYYLNFIEEFEHIDHLAKADEKQILKLWQGLGYYSRARNLHQTAIYISTELQGQFPEKYEDMIKLKGIGDYTASAISSICFKEARATLDGNVYRVLSRYFGISTPINSSKGNKEFKKLAELLLDPRDPGTHNQAVMELGALICKPKNPDCINCPLNDSCNAKQSNRIKELPLKENKIKVRNRYFNYLVINSNNKHTYIKQRNLNDIWKNLFEFPLLESEKELEFPEIINTTTFQELVKNRSYHLIKFNSEQIVHKLTHQRLYTNFWIIETEADLNQMILWEDLEKFALPTLIQNFVDHYKKTD